MLKLSFRQQVFLGFAVSIFLVVVVGALSYNSIHQLEDDTEWVEHTQTVINTSDDMLQQLIDAETAMRGYCASDKKDFLGPYNTAVPNVQNDVEKLKSLVVDNPLQVRRVDSIASEVNIELGIIKENIDTRDAKGLEYMAKNNMFLDGKQNMDSIRNLRQRLNAEENSLLAKRKASSRAAATNAIIIIVVGSLIFLLIIIVLFQYIQKTFGQQKEAEDLIKNTNIELEKVISKNTAQNWLLTGSGTLNEKMQGQQSEKELSKSILTEVCRYTKAITGTLYLFNESEDVLELYAYYAFHDLSVIKDRVKLSEGWLGQVATDKVPAVIRGTLNDKLELETSIISQELAEIMIVPFFFDKKLKGVIEIAF